MRPDRRAVVDATTARPRLIERPRPHGTAFAVFALSSAAVVTVGLATIVPAVRDRAVQPSGVPPAVDPIYRNHADVYPMLTDVPAWAGEMAPTFLSAPTATSRQRVWALVARHGSDSLQGPIVISTGDPTTLDPANGYRVADVAGAPTYLFDDPTGLRTALVVSDDDVNGLMVSGMVDQHVLVDVLHGITLHLSEKNTTFTVGDLPTGYDVIVEPTVQPQAVDSYGIATSPASAAEGSLAIDVVTDLSDLRFYSSREGAPVLRSIFIGGTGEQLTGWYAMPTPNSIVLAWTLDPGIVLVLKATRDSLTPTEALAIAKDVVLTDSSTWTEAYGPVVTAAGVGQLRSTVPPPST